MASQNLLETSFPTARDHRRPAENTDSLASTLVRTDLPKTWPDPNHLWVWWISKHFERTKRRNRISFQFDLNLQIVQADQLSGSFSNRSLSLKHQSGWGPRSGMLLNILEVGDGWAGSIIKLSLGCQRKFRREDHCVQLAGALSQNRVEKMWGFTP